MSKEHQPTHVNRWSGEVLENKEQVCPACHLNFGTTEAGDKHRDLSSTVFLCHNPLSVGLVSVENDFGTLVWRISNDS